MRRLISAGLALSAMTLSLVATNAAQAQVIPNGNFETPVQGAGNFTYNPAGGSFTFTGNSGISGNGSGFTSGNPNAPQGVQVGFIQNQGSFTQTLSGFATPLQTSFSFLAARRGNFNANVETFNVLLNGTIIGTFAPTSTTYSLFTTSIATLNSGANSNTLTFAGTNPFQTGDAAAFVDNIQGTAAPEPGSALLLIPGLMGLVGVVRRRARK